MFSRLRRQFGTAGLIVAIVALVAALAGGAYAASGGLTGKQKKEVTKIAQKEAKKAQGTGPAGPQGSAGANGKDGTNGTNGKDGVNGTNGSDGTDGEDGQDGTDGTNGKNVEVGTPGGTECGGRGGATVQVAGEPATKKAVCNGEEGESGFTETLPPGETETGSWTFVAGGAGTAPISLSIPLAEEIPALNVVIMLKDEAAQSGCTGGTAEDPKADPGFLCVYTGTGEAEPAPLVPTVLKAGGELAGGVSTAGAIIFAENPTGPLGFASGTWAVTAPLPPA
jgi:hypothetical protein